jgi:hypothetical protein
MITDRYYYNRLSDREKQVYTELYKGVTALDKEIYVSMTTPQELDIHKIFQAVTKDNPYLYYFNQTCMSVGQSQLGIALLPQYFCTRDQIDTYNGRIQEKVNQLMIDLDLQNASEVEKEYRIHDYMVKNVVYDYEALHTQQYGRLIAAHSIIGVFSRQRAVCEGISKAAKLLFNTANMGCMVVTGKASIEKMQEHAWNIVNVDRQAYHLDITWDLVNSKDRKVNYDYFNVTEKNIRRDHFDFTGVPVCTATKDNYFIKNHLYFATVGQAKHFIEKELRKGTQEFYIQLGNNLHDMKRNVAEIREFILSVLESEEVQWKVECSYNEEQRTARFIASAVV